jgi:ADP-heptose:LPS heptosyltransferase
VKSILVFRSGSLGDTLVAVPSLWRIREHYRDARVTLLCDEQPGLLYPLDRSLAGRAKKYLRMLRLLFALRRRRFDVLVYLIATGRTPAQLHRDRKFFKLAGIRTILGLDLVRQLPVKEPGRRLEPMPRESEILLNRLTDCGISGQTVRTDIALTATDHARVDDWLAKQPPDSGRPWLAVAPGSRMPAKVWPAERYLVVVRRLIERFDIWPVVFGDSADAEVGNRLLTDWGRGYNAAGSLDVRSAVAAIARSRLYLGNDTGTMHMAASEGVPCVAVFAAHAPPGLWYPLGEGHQVFRTATDCEGCGLTICIERRMECVLAVGIEPVLAACERVLSGRVALR